MIFVGVQKFCHLVKLSSFVNRNKKATETEKKIFIRVPQVYQIALILGNPEKLSL